MAEHTPRISINFGEADNLAAALSKAYTEFMGELEDMENDLRILETWEGQAGDDYRTEKQRWDAAQLEVAKTMKKFGPTVQNANEILQEAERQNVARWGN
jgi:WXG100 family type VII secretion target